MRYAGLAVGCDDVDAEEGHPAHQEYTHDYADGDRGLVVGDVVRAGWLRLRLRLRRLRATALRTKTLGHGGVRQLRHRADTLHMLLRVAIEPRKRRHSLTWDDTLLIDQSSSASTLLSRQRNEETERERERKTTSIKNSSALRCSVKQICSTLVVRTICFLRILRTKTLLPSASFLSSSSYVIANYLGASHVI